MKNDNWKIGKSLTPSWIAYPGRLRRIDWYDRKRLLLACFQLNFVLLDANQRRVKILRASFTRVRKSAPYYTVRV